MRKHLYRKSAWEEGVPRSLNYRSVLSGALYGSGRVGGLTAHSSLRRPSRHRPGWRFLTFPFPGRPRGRRAPPLRYLPRRTPAPVPVSAGLQAGGPPCLGTPALARVHPQHLRSPPAHADFVETQQLWGTAASTEQPNSPRPLQGTAGTPRSLS